jgi:hypothetical protein
VLFSGTGPFAEVQYNVHNEDAKKAFSYANINLSATTHAFRKSGAKGLDEAG